MKDAGLQCSGPVVIGAIVKWKCEESTSDHHYSVDVIGRSPSEIEVVSATSLNFGSQNTNTVARDFLSYVATVPYDGSSRAAAKAWIQENVGTQEVEKTFGSVRIQLLGDARARILRMAPAKTQ